MYYENWDFVIQQQLHTNWLFEAGYSGREGHHLFDRYTINRIDPLTGKRPLTGFGSFNNNFNALMLSLHRRFVTRVSFPDQTGAPRRIEFMFRAEF